jgi:hypothetical protein
MSMLPAKLRSYNNGGINNRCYNASDQIRLEDSAVPFTQKLSKLKNERGLTQKEVSRVLDYPRIKTRFKPREENVRRFFRRIFL